MKKHVFFYNQYKHGLKIALRPFANFTPEQVIFDKQKVLKTICHDSLKMIKSENDPQTIQLIKTVHKLCLDRLRVI